MAQTYQLKESICITPGEILMWTKIALVPYSLKQTKPKFCDLKE